jgi:Mor family transcriptional regulator
MARGSRSSPRALLLFWLYRDFADPVPQNFKNRKREARNAEIRLRFADGSDAVELSRAYGVSVKRIYQIVHHQRK